MPVIKEFSTVIVLRDLVQNRTMKKAQLLSYRDEGKLCKVKYESDGAISEVLTEDISLI